MEFFVSRHETEWNVTEWNVLFFFCSFCKYLSTLHYLIHLRMSWCFYRTIILFSFSPCVWARTLSYLVQCTVYSRRLYIHSAQKRNEQCNVKTTDLKHVVYKVCVCVCRCIHQVHKSKSFADEAPKWVRATITDILCIFINLRVQLHTNNTILNVPFFSLKCIYTRIWYAALCTFTPVFVCPYFMFAVKLSF